MAQHPFFEISPDQIASLGDEDLRLLIAELCKADLRQRVLPTSAVLYGGNQIAADGGIDVCIKNCKELDIHLSVSQLGNSRRQARMPRAQR